jgi:hypothetical protein
MKGGKEREGKKDVARERVSCPRYFKFLKFKETSIISVISFSNNMHFIYNFIFLSKEFLTSSGKNKQYNLSDSFKVRCLHGNRKRRGKNKSKG